MTQAKKTPIALFVYNRPDYARETLLSLERCRRLSECQLVIFSDAAKKPEHEEGVQATRRLIRPLAAKLNAEIIERSENYGLGRSIIEGVGQLCQSCGRAIVVEDDLLLHPSFLDYMLPALDLYENDARVAQISAYMFPVKHPPKPDTFFLPLATTWGWGTWQRVWKSISWDTSQPAEDLRDPLFRNNFDMQGAYPYCAILQDRIQGRNHSWGILFWYNIFKRGLLVLYPRASFVWVGGLDRSGTNFSASQEYDPLLLQQFFNPPRNRFLRRKVHQPIGFPNHATVNQQAFERVLQHLKSQQPGEKSSPRLLTRIRHLYHLGRTHSMTVLWARAKRKWFNWLDEQLKQHRQPPVWQAAIAPTAKVEAEAVIENLAGAKERIVIGDHSVLRGRLLTYGHGGKIHIGDWCYIGARSEIWSMDSIEIGNRVLIAHDVNIHDGNAYSLDPAERHLHFRQTIEKGRPLNQAELPGIASAPIVIEDDVWISFGATILKGVRIGKGSVIAAKSIVVHDVPPYTFYRCEIKPILQPLKEKNVSTHL